MKLAVFLLVALVCAPAAFAFPTPPENVPPQCIDPTFACQDLENARLCGVVKSCIHDIWSTMTAPNDNDEICDLCKKMVKEARDQLLSNMTQEEIKEVFEGSCKLMPVKLIADACIKIVDEIIPELVEMLASRMDPTMVCTVSGLCNLAHLPIKENKADIQDVLVCEFCTHVLEHIKELITANTTVEEFRTALLNFCKHTGSFSDKCTNLVTEYYDTIFAFIRNLDTKGFCTLMGLCDKQRSSAFMIPAVKLIPAFEAGKKFPMVKLVPPQAVTDDHMFIHPFIKIEPAMVSSKKAPSSLATVESNEIFDRAPEQLPVERFSHPQTSFLQNTECAFCRAIAFFVEKDLHGERSEESVETALNHVCEKWVTEYPDHCKAFTDKYSQHVKKFIVNNASFSKLCLSVKACSAEDANDFKVRVVPPENSNPLCDLCKETFDEIENQLKDPATKANLENILDQVCNYLPKSVQSDCKSFVNQNVNTLFSILEQELQGNIICPALRLCPTSLRPTVGNVKTVECDLCKDFVKQIQAQLQDPNVKQSLKSLLEQGCSVLPSEIASECKTFVDQNIDNLINILVQDLDPNTVCTALKLCTGSVKKITLPKVTDIECDLCKEVVQKVDDELKDQRTEEEIREALDKVCTYLPSSMTAKCENFVNTYSAMIITLLAQELDPNLICAAIKLCPAKSKDLRQWREKAQGLECESCKYFFHFVQNQLMDSNVQTKIKGTLERVCKLLPSTYSDNCVAYIQEFGDSLLVIIAQYLDPSVICGDLKVCPAIGKTPDDVSQIAKVKPLKLDKCSLCTNVVDYLDKLLEEDDIDKEITALVQKVCTIVPASVKDECSILIQTYGPYILQMIGQLANSKEVCQDIDMCPRPSGHVHLLGGKKCTFGPSYWCQSKVHAAACKAEMFCRSNVWKE